VTARVHATSPAQQDAWRRGVVPEAEEVAGGAVIAVPLATRIAHIPFSLAYVVVGRGGEIHLIDPGMDLPENWGSLERGLARFGRRIDEIASVLVTHLHTDHTGMANALRARTGAAVRIHRDEHLGLRARNPIALTPYDEWGVPDDRREVLRAGIVERVPIDATAFVEHDDEIDLGTTVLRALRTPGHTSGHLCFVADDLGLMFTGDHVLPTMNPGLGLGLRTDGNPVADYLDALEATAARADVEALPGHGYRFHGLAVRCRQIADHVEARRRDVQGALDRAPAATVWEVAAAIPWSAGWGNLDGFYLQSALYQTSLYVDLCRTPGRCVS
jgi:glyoxylase-like metal-dependent hydrolase (beta-lactamase superfamily II)